VTDGPAKPKTASRFIATGCTIVIVVAGAIAALVGFAFYRISRGMDEIAELGSSWLSRQPEAGAEFGEIQRIERVPERRSLDVGRGQGWFEYRVTGSKRSGLARVSVVKHEGEWRAVGARLTLGDREAAIGTPP
jgi:hypothetical protein